MCRRFSLHYSHWKATLKNMANNSYCLLGFIDESIVDTQKFSLDFRINKIGGRPNWCGNGVNSNPRCSMCQKELPLVVQIYAPLDESPNHRTLYIFGCINQSCQLKFGSWICLRDEICEISTDSLNVKISSTVTAFESCSWLDGADDWGEEGGGENGNLLNSNDNSDKEERSSPEIESQKLNYAKSQGTVGPPSLEANYASAEIEMELGDNTVICVDAPFKPAVDLKTLLHQPATEIPDITNVEFICFYINVIEEYLCSNEKADERAQDLWKDYQQRENCSWIRKSFEKPSAGNSEEGYEKTIPTHGDELVYKFINRVQQNPQQIVRYNRESNPLLLTRTVGTLPLCKYCGSKLLFELQLMPYINQILTFIECPSLSNPLRFGTVVIFTCSKSCWELNSAPRQEYVIVQAEIE